MSHQPIDQRPIFSVSDLLLGRENSVSVVSESGKFVLPVPALRQPAEPLIYPAGHPQAGEAILDYSGYSESVVISSY